MRLYISAFYFFFGLYCNLFYSSSKLDFPILIFILNIIIYIQDFYPLFSKISILAIILKPIINFVFSLAFMQLWMMLGQIATQVGDVAMARDAYSKGLKNCPTSIPLWILSATLEETSG
jgi:hypothetical protein